jgi:ABC-type sulfate transport system permease component
MLWSMSCYLAVMLAVKWTANMLTVLTAAMRVSNITVVNAVQEHFKSRRRSDATNESGHTPINSFLHDKSCLG